MERRNFLKTISAFTIFASFTNVPAISENKKIIKPARLKHGDTIGLIAPGSFITNDELKTSISNIEALGFKTVYTDNILKQNGYLAGTDEERAADVNEMFGRKDVKGIIAVRGGYGCTRILPLINYNLIKKNPKVLVGYSDVTALLFAIYANTGMVAFHGPVGISTFNNFSIDYFKKVLMNPFDSLTLNNLDEPNTGEKSVYSIRSGSANGVLAGGNLSIVVSLIGTPYDIDTNGKIIFLEEVGEEPYRIDRMLTQMLEAGKFDNAAGIALGVFSKCEPKGEESGILNSFTLSEVLYDRLYNLNLPVVYGMSFGHINNKFTLPFGIKANLNSIEKTITLLEKAVL